MEMSMSMGSMSMSMAPTSTMGMSMPSASSGSDMAGMDHDMGGMDMGAMKCFSELSVCQVASHSHSPIRSRQSWDASLTPPVSMLLNYETAGTCFISDSWYNATTGVYAGSLVGVFFLTMAIELVRRLAREYDRRLSKTLTASRQCKTDRVPWLNQVVRGVLYGGQFTAAFFV